MRTQLPSALLATALACSLFTAPAQAAAARTFVSAAGSDSNNCTNVATPCRHLAAAYAATAPNGEIYVLDPANYGSLTITGPVSIEGHGWASIAPVANNAAITINANAGDKINIIGVVLDGTAVSNTTGIQYNSGGSLTVRDSVIRNFSGGGINFNPNTSDLSLFYVSNTLVSDNGGGIGIGPAGTGTTNSVLDHVVMENNVQNGLIVSTPLQEINVTVSDSVSANNGEAGILASSLGGTPVYIMVRNSTIANNAGDGLDSFGSSGTEIRITRCMITGNKTGGWSTASGGLLFSYGDNTIDNNMLSNGLPPLKPYK